MFVVFVCVPTFMRRFLHFWQPARDFLCDLRGAMADEASYSQTDKQSQKWNFDREEGRLNERERNQDGGKDSES